MIFSFSSSFSFSFSSFLQLLTGDNLPFVCIFFSVSEAPILLLDCYLGHGINDCLHPRSIQEVIVAEASGNESCNLSEFGCADYLFVHRK